MLRKGFAFIELIFVIVVLGILASVAVPKLAKEKLGEDSVLVKAGAEIREELNKVKNDMNQNNQNNSVSSDEHQKVLDKLQSSEDEKQKTIDLLKKEVNKIKKELKESKSTESIDYIRNPKNLENSENDLSSDFMNETDFTGTGY